MMLIVAGTFTLQSPGERDRFLEATSELTRGSAAEAACVRYTFSADPLNENVVNLFEIWESENSLQAHFEEDHYRAFSKNVMPTFKVEKQTKIYYVDEVREVGDWR